MGQTAHVTLSDDAYQEQRRINSKHVQIHAILLLTDNTIYREPEGNQDLFLLALQLGYKKLVVHRLKHLTMLPNSRNVNLMICEKINCNELSNKMGQNRQNAWPFQQFFMKFSYLL